jgi:SAM-dependent methyltransferase
MTGQHPDLTAAFAFADRADEATLHWWRPEGVASMAKADAAVRSGCCPVITTSLTLGVSDDARVLKPEEDAYGQMMLDHLRDGSGYEIVEHDDGFVGIGAGPRLYFAEFDAWRQTERDAMEHVRGRVLDVGCGAGRFMRWLRDRGHEVVGVDISPGAIEACRLQGLTETHVLSVGQVSRRLGSFDTVLLLGGNMALLGPRDQARRNLVRLRAVASPGARLLGANRDVTVSGDVHVRERIDANHARNRFSGEHRSRIRYRTFKTPYFTSARMNVAELRDLVEDTGWSVTEVLDRGEGIYIAVLDVTS